MAQLVIQGHATRGKEVIEILEMLGGSNTMKWDGVYDGLMYFINNDGDIDSTGFKHSYMEVFTLEEFLEKYPHKVGDKVLYHQTYAVINEIKWTGREIEYIVEYKKELWTTTAFYLEPYKEETMEEKENSVIINIEHKQLKVHSLRFDKTQLVINDEYELKQEGDTYYIVRKKIQYPKSYEECCEVLFPNSIELGKVLTSGCNCELLKKLGELLICRDAYWKIAGEQMGLGKPWKPDWLNVEQDKFVLYTHNDVICSNRFVLGHNVLAFPTAEMRDAFYENFKNKIEQCKELL